MKKMILALAVATLLIGAPAIAGDGAAWVTDTGHRVELAGSHTMMFHEGGETFDLSDLRDGETRDFGQGAKQITVAREGDDVLIVREQSGDESALELKCHVTDDTCQVVTFADDPEKVMIVVAKTRTCVKEDGEGDCADSIDVTLDRIGGLAGDGHHAIVRKIKCDDAGNCEEFEDIVKHGMTFTAEVDSAHGGNVVVLSGAPHMEGKVMLACPEGDATVNVDKEESDETFLCPKHNVPMELSAHPMPLVRKIRVKQSE